ncbi:MAG: hypothetical protein ACP5GD_02770 [Candidatus Micrarchaeia archaeon]
MASAGKALLGGIILGIIIVIALETLVALAFLSSQGVKNPFQFVKSVLSSIPQLSSLNLSAIKGINITSLKNLANITKQTSQKSYINVSEVVIVARLNVNESKKNASMLGLLTYKQAGNGFVSRTGSVSNYTFSIPDDTQFPMNIISVEAATPGFEVAYVFPKLPHEISPGGIGNFTAIIKMPSTGYSGNLLLNVSANVG